MEVRTLLRIELVAMQLIKVVCVFPMSWNGIESKGENEELIILVQEFSRPSSMDFLAISLKMQLELE